jgi:hypothetical protein
MQVENAQISNKTNTSESKGIYKKQTEARLKGVTRATLKS